MKKSAAIFLSILLASAAALRADQTTESVQQILKDQGFYFGEVNGNKDAETVAAIRRYQIRNGLQVTGELNDETKQSMGIGANVATRPAATPPPDTSDLRDATSTTPLPTARTNRRDTESDEAEPDTAPRNVQPYPGQPYAAPRDYENPDAQSYRAPFPPTGGPINPLFVGTPYQAAPAPLQRQVIIAAQVILMRRGYYREGIDGIYGPGMEFSLRAYQSRLGLQPSGRLDVETLSSLELMPGQRAATFAPPNGARIWPGRTMEPPVRGEWVR